MSDQSAGELDAILASLAEPFPPQDIYQRAGSGGKQLSYISGTNVIARLQNTVIDWSFEITETRMEQTVDRNGEITPIFTVIGKISIPGLGSRAGIGVAAITPGSGEDAYKGAATDCLKKCASLFGVGFHLYEEAQGQRSGVVTRTAPSQQYGNSYQELQTQSRPAQRSTGPDGAEPSGTVTDKQARMIYALLRATDTDVNETMARFGIDRTNEIGYEDGQALIEELQAKQARTGDTQNRGVTSSMGYERQF